MAAAALSAEEADQLLATLGSLRDVAESDPYTLQRAGLTEKQAHAISNFFNAT
jgi:hypothetical protein